MLKQRVEFLSKDQRRAFINLPESRNDCRRTGVHKGANQAIKFIAALHLTQATFTGTQRHEITIEAQIVHDLLAGQRLAGADMEQ